MKSSSLYNDSLMRPSKHVKRNKIKFLSFLICIRLYNYKLDVDLTYVLSRDKTHAGLLINHDDGWKRNKLVLFKSRTLKILILRQFLEEINRDLRQYLFVSWRSHKPRFASLKTGVKNPFNKICMSKIKMMIVWEFWNAIPNPYVMSLKIVNPQ